MGYNSEIEFEDRVKECIRVNEHKFYFLDVPKRWLNTVTIKCKKCGHEETRKSECFFRGSSYKLIKKCKNCEIVNFKNTTYTLEEAKEIFKSKGYILLATKYKNCKTKMKYLCTNCNKEYYMNLDNMINDRGCPTCSITKITDKRIIEKVNELGYELLNFNRNDNGISILLELKCKEGHVFTVNWDTIRNKEEYICMVCRGFRDSKEGKSQEMYKREIEEYCAKENLPYEFIKAYKRHYANSKSTWLILNCKEHGKFEVNKVDFMTRWKQRCPICTGNASKGEIRISEILNNYNIDFIREHSFEDCRNIMPLPFDFYLPENEIFIEFNGNEHYESIKFFGGDEKFKQRQINDNIKREYCKDKKLIEIPYWEFDNIEEILKKELNLQNEAVVK